MGQRLQQPVAVPTGDLDEEISAAGKMNRWSQFFNRNLSALAACDFFPRRQYLLKMRHHAPQHRCRRSSSRPEPGEIPVETHIVAKPGGISDLFDTECRFVAHDRVY